MKGTATTLAALVAAVALGAGIGAATFALLDDDPATTTAEATADTNGGTTEPAGNTSSSSTIADVYERTYKSVVEITASGFGSDQFGNQSEQQAQGSGFVYDEEGHIVTNQHVVDGSSSLSVRFWNGTRRSAEVVGTDPSTDLAVLKVDAPESLLVPLRLANSSGLEVGDEVLAIGSPFGL
jgi:S1-C subfamily serine protease